MTRQHTVIFLTIVTLTLALFAGCTRAPQAPAEPAQTTPETTATPTSPAAEPAMPATAATTQPAAQSNETPVTGGWLINRLSAEMSTLNPYTSTDAYSANILGYIFESLLRRDDATLEMRPSLAKSWQVSDDHLTYTFQLDERATFSDGTPVTAEDVKFSFDTIKSPDVDAPQLRNYYKDVTDCAILDPHQVRFTCDKPYFRHLIMLGGFEILPKHLYSEGNFNESPYNRKPVGSGPYTFEKWETGQELVLDRNPKYWGAERRGYFDKRVYRIITDENAAFQVLLRQDLDAMTLSPEQWVRRSDTPNFADAFNKFSYYQPYYNYIGWNMRRPLFEDKLVRRALTMLLDRQTILKEVYYGLAIAVTGNFFIDSPEYDKDIKPWPFDPEAAKKLLAQEGWTDSNQDGVLDKNGTDFAFEMLIVNANPIAERIAAVFQDQLRAVGIQMTIRPLEWATLLQSIDGRDFDACMMGWQMPPDPDPYQVWHSSQAEKGSNLVGFKNAEADELIEKARVTFNRDERIQLYHRFQEILHDEQPYTFMFCSKSLLAVAKRIHGITMYPYGPDSLEWFVPKDQQRYPE